jgi:hypothetical protein
MARQQVSVPLSEEQMAFVDQRADAEDRSRASVVRRIVEAARVAGQGLPRVEQQQWPAA